MSKEIKYNTQVTKELNERKTNLSTNHEDTDQEVSEMNISETLQSGTKAANTTNKVFAALTEHKEQQESAFLKEHRSKAGTVKLVLVEDALVRNEIKLDDALAKLTQIQENDTSETVKLLNAHSAARKVQGDTGLKIGVGIGLGAGGSSLLIWVLSKVFKKKAS